MMLYVRIFSVIQPNETHSLPMKQAKSPFRLSVVTSHASKEFGRELRLNMEVCCLRNTGSTLQVELLCACEFHRNKVTTKANQIKESTFKNY